MVNIYEVFENICREYQNTFNFQLLKDSILTGKSSVKHTIPYLIKYKDKEIIVDVLSENANLLEKIIKLKLLSIDLNRKTLLFIDESELNDEEKGIIKKGMHGIEIVNIKDCKEVLEKILKE